MSKSPQMSEPPALDIINDTDEEIETAVLVTMAEEILRQERPDSQCYATLYICDDEQMQIFNKQYRGATQATDVLAFGATQGNLEPESGTAKTFLGDIVVDINQAYRQKGSNSILKEIQILVIHGLLHLLGYDHIKTQDKKNMEQKENYYKQTLVGR
ncbi:MAG: rRNA maturation RNase YbeY [Candidatus Cloacimonadaceae bacterium]|jgi:probable rRNA maturation factor